MQVTSILDDVDGGHVNLPAFKLGDVWNDDQVCGFARLVYCRLLADGLQVWATQSEYTCHRADNSLAPSVVTILAGYPSEILRVLQNNETRARSEYRTPRLAFAAYDALVAFGMRPRPEGWR